MSAPRVSLYRGKFLELAAIGKWEFVQRVRGNTPVGIVALTAEGKVLLISQYRVPVGKVCVEIPAGLVGDGDASEDWRHAAMRELREETGYTAERLELLTQGPTSAGLTSECMTFVRAHGVKKAGDLAPDGDEQITLHEVPLEKVEAFLAERSSAGDLIDPKVFVTLYFLTRSK